MSDGSTKSMSTLAIGDETATGRVTNWIHRTETTDSTNSFLRIVVGGGEELVVSRAHLIWINGAFDFAGVLRVGDALVRGDGEDAIVVSVTDITNRDRKGSRSIANGLYAPLTTSGELVVNGFKGAPFSPFHSSLLSLRHSFDLPYDIIKKSEKSLTTSYSFLYSSNLATPPWYRACSLMLRLGAVRFTPIRPAALRSDASCLSDRCRKPNLSHRLLLGCTRRGVCCCCAHSLVPCNATPFQSRCARELVRRRARICSVSEGSVRENIPQRSV